jgi:NADPH-dependent curcumin reductase CurA
MAGLADINRQVLIAELPKGKLAPEHFKVVEASMPALGEAEVLLRTRYVIIDAAMRAWMLGPSYRAALKAGDVMAGAALLEVVESRVAGFAPGDLVYADDAGCQEYAVLAATKLRSLARLIPSRTWSTCTAPRA